MIYKPYYLIILALTLWCATSYRTLLQPRWSAGTKNILLASPGDADAMYEDQEDPERFASLQMGLQYFREYAKRAISRFQAGDINGALADFDRAAAANSTQPLQQRGMVKYIAGFFEEAEQQFRSDIAKLEEMKEHKAVELRLWHSASLNRLGLFEEAKAALDIDNHLCFPPAFESAMLNQTQEFYAGRVELEEMLHCVGSVEDGDIDAGGRVFYGNFYLGLYFDSMQQMDMAQVFLSIPYTRSAKKSKRDMWHHLPRALYEMRFPDDAGDADGDRTGSGEGGAGDAVGGTTSGNAKVTKSGFFF